MNSKVVDQLTLYHFYTSRPWFGSTDFAGYAIEHGRKLGFSEQRLQALTCIFTHFHSKPAMPLNMKVVSLDKTHNFCIGRI
jgi:hypothetical protein